MERSGTSKAIIFILLLFFCQFLFNSVQAKECGAGKRPLFFHVDTSADYYTPRGFTERLFSQLKLPLEAIGYCITPFDTVVLADSTNREELLMVLSMQLLVSEHQAVRYMTAENNNTPDSETVLTIDTAAYTVVSLLRVDSWSLQQLKRAAENPLLSLAYTPEDLSTFESVLIRKIVENLRMQVICHLRIQSIPSGATVRSNRGAEGTTPLEWIMPVGRLSITCELAGYEPIHRKIDLPAPGTHEYVIEMGKRRFYHSRFFLPTLVLGASSAGCFIAERVFYSKYQRLGKEDRGRNPDPFEQNFTIAKNFERASAGTLALGITMFTLCFFF